jgi:hypothetical protein
MQLAHNEESANGAIKIHCQRAWERYKKKYAITSLSSVHNQHDGQSAHGAIQI